MPGQGPGLKSSLCPLLWQGPARQHNGTNSLKIWACTPNESPDVARPPAQPGILTESPWQMGAVIVLDQGMGGSPDPAGVPASALAIII